MHVVMPVLLENYDLNNVWMRTKVEGPQMLHFVHSLSNENLD